MWGAKMLELRAIGAGVLRQGHQQLGSVEITVVIGGDIGNEVRGAIWADGRVPEGEIHHMGHPSDGPLRAARVNFTPMISA